MTSQREAKKRARQPGIKLVEVQSTALVVAREPWEEKLRRAILTGRPGIIEAQLTAWAAFDTAMQAESGRPREFRFNPAQVARAARIKHQYDLSDAEWPLYGAR